jgi:O-Antigen ligase
VCGYNPSAHVLTCVSRRVFTSACLAPTARVNAATTFGLEGEIGLALNAPEMEPPARPERLTPGPDTAPTPTPAAAHRHHRRHRHGRARTPKLYNACDWITEGMLYGMVVFGPWAFGTTQHWSMWVMNGAGYALGALLITKWIIRWRTGYEPVRWGEASQGAKGKAQGAKGEGQREEGRGRTTDIGGQQAGFRISEWTRRISARTLTRWLAVLTVVMLGYCFVSAVNPHSTYHPDRRWFEPHSFVAWLPHSYDSSSTWFAFWQYLGLAFVFWAVRDWLLGKTHAERSRSESRNQKAEMGNPRSPIPLGTRSSSSSAPLGSPSSVLRPPSSGSALPSRLNRLLWVVCLNGAVLALESILQRLSGTNKLLWLKLPHWNRTAESQFGPYAYRGNAAEYLNLVWPVCLAFWWTLRCLAGRGSDRTVRAGGRAYVILLPCVVLIAAGPIISTARGGAAVAAGALVVATTLLLLERHGSYWQRLGVAGLFVAVLTLAGWLGWTQLEARLKTVFTDDLSGRTEIYANARQMTKDFVWLGSGPNTFAPLYQMYRADLNQVWQAWAHDDWLEFRITFGRLGFCGLLAMLIAVFLRWFGSGGLHLPRIAVRMFWLALAGCLAHARFDFPLHVYSVLFLFILWCSVLFCLSRRFEVEP